MNKYLSNADAIFSVVIGFVVSLLGGVDQLLILMLTAIICDVITGILLAFKNKNVSSSRMQLGLLKKMSYFIMIILAVQVDRFTGNTNVCRSMMLMLIVSNEGISVIENYQKIAGDKSILPKKFIEFFEKLKDSDKKDGDSNE